MKKLNEIKRFVADAVIDNHSYKNAITLFKVDATNIIEVKGECYTICNQHIRSADTGFKHIEIRCKYAYGVIKRTTAKDLHQKHLFNIDMVVYFDDKIWVTPIYYFYTNSQKEGENKCKMWLNTVSGKEYMFNPTKQQIKAVMKWIVDISNESKYKNAPVYELHKKASVFIVDECIKVLEQTGCITVKDINGVVVCIATTKGVKALANK